MTRIGMFAHELDPAKATGIARYTRGLAGALNELLRDTSDEVVVVTAPGCGQVPGDHHELRVRRRYLYMGWLLLSVPRAEWLVPEVDVVHVTAPVVPVPTRRPLVVTLHDLLPITHPHWYPPREVAVFRRCLSWMEKAADVVIVPTETVAEEAVRSTAISASRLVVTGEGVDLDHFRPVEGTSVLAELGLRSRGYLLYLGQVSSRKNLVRVIEALDGVPWSLLIVGPDGFGAAEVHTAAASARHDVRLLGRLPDAAVGELVREARALVHPSLYEGFGLTVLEAMAVGTPVVVSDAGALPEVAGMGALTVSGDESDAWRAALQGLGDEALLARLSAAGLARAAEWSWAETAARTVDAYTQAQVSHGRRP